MKEIISDSIWLIAIETIFVILAITLFKLTNKADVSFWYLILGILIVAIIIIPIIFYSIKRVIIKK